MSSEQSNDWWSRLKHVSKTILEGSKEVIASGAEALKAYIGRREQIEKMIATPIATIQYELASVIPSMPDDAYQQFMTFLQRMILEQFPHRYTLPQNVDTAMSIIAQESATLPSEKRVRVTKLGAIMLMAWTLRQYGGRA